jgi:DNA-directed RNA polymerase alpha subunit
MGFSTRIINALRHADIDTLEELLTYSKRELLRISSLGKNSVGKIIIELNNLGMKLKDDI